MKVGLIIMDEDPRTAVAVAKAADKAGVHSIWTIDYYNRSSLTRAATFLAATDRVGVGTSVTPLFARSPLALAAAAHDLQELADGRFTLGVGSSTRRMNADWYGIDLDHPAPRVAERIDLVRRLLSHQSGPFSFSGRFDRVEMAHFEHAGKKSSPVPIVGAAVGNRMVEAVARSADGLVGHPIASAACLHELRDRALQWRSAHCVEGNFEMCSQIVASVNADSFAARKAADQQVGFYATVKGYDALFSTQQEDEARASARRAFVKNDVTAVAEAAHSLTGDRAVFGSAEQVIAALQRYSDVLDVALLYPPHYGVSAAEVTKNEMALIEVASAATHTSEGR